MRRDSGSSGSSGSGAGSGAGNVGAATVLTGVAEAMAALADLDPRALDERQSVRAITALERLKNAAAAAQARLGVRVDECARERQRAEGVRPKRVGAGVAAQIALARQESPSRGGRHLGLGQALVHELPQTLAAMARGDVSEWRATVVARETACLDPEVRLAIDAQIAGDLPAWGDGQTEREVRALSQHADPGAAVRRRAQAVSDRRVTLRPAPDTMCYLTALLPVEQGVATYAALVREADRARATGDANARGRAQVMADTLVERATGQARACDVPVEIELVMPVDILLGDGQAPAEVTGYGPVPAAVARQLARDTPASVWLRRLFVAPDTGRVVGLDSRRRLFDGELPHLLILRDRFCRTPWCDAPIRHGDHVRPHRDQGPTAEDNGQGLCETCSYAKEAPGWRTTPGASRGRHTVIVTTPTGERHTSKAPRPP